MKYEVKILDLNFQRTPGVIASYLIPHDSGVILIESGPGSTAKSLVSQLSQHGFSLDDVTDIFVTHIHLDHAGAAGWLSQKGIRIHVHPFGAPHLVDPTRLISSATRIYKDKMEELWGEIIPADPDKISILENGKTVSINGIKLIPLDTPGHANHHMAFRLGEICFSGDIGGVRMFGSSAIRAPMPPPEFHLEHWRTSITMLLDQPIQAIAPTHFGIYDKPKEHLQMLEHQLNEAENWMIDVLASTSDTELEAKFDHWMDQKALADQLGGKYLHGYELANPSFMSLAGIKRYWQKHRSM